MNALSIANWLDDKHHRLFDYYKKGNIQECKLFHYANYINESNDQAWSNHLGPINISR